MHRWFVSLIWAVVLAVLSGVAAGEPVVLWDPVASPPPRVSGGTARLDAGRLVVDLVPGRNGPAVVRIALPAGVDVARFATLDAVLGVESTETGGARLRWMFLDDAGQGVRQHGFGVVASDPGVRPISLQRFRWPNQRVGSFSEARTLALIAESAEITRVTLGPVRLVPPADAAVAGPSAYLATAELVRLAFTADPIIVAGDGVVVAIEPGPNVSVAAARQVLEDAVAVRAVLRRLLGPALRPLDPAEETAILLFQTPASRAQFFRNLGRHYSVSISPPTAVGYTVQNMATALWDRQLAARRPVILHEAVHALLAHEARLLPGLPAHAWLQEGLASYVQVCVYPDSIDRRFYPAEFRLAVDGGLGSGRLLPFAEVIGRPAEQVRYPQLAVMVAALLDRRPEVLQRVIRLAAEGATLDRWPEDGLPPLADLEAEVLRWGRDRFLQPSGPPVDPFAPLPEIAPRR